MANNRFGIAIGYNEIKTGIVEYMRECGYDYVEMNLSNLIDISAKEFEFFQNIINYTYKKIEVFNLIFPYNMRIVGNTANSDKIKEYIKKASEIISMFKSDLIIIGSGNSRKYNEDDSIFKVKNSFQDIIYSLEMLNPGVEIAIEPLCRKETNFLNTVEEVIRYKKEYLHNSIGVMIDYYHMSNNAECLNEIIQLETDIRHVHIATSIERIIPYNDLQVKTFLQELLDSNYKKRISVEATDNFNKEGVLKMIKTFRTLERED